MDDAIRLLEAVTRLLAVLVWPGLAVFVLFRFGSSLQDFVVNLGELTLKGAGVEATAKRKQADATSALTAAILSRPEPGEAQGTAAREARNAFRVVAEVVTPQIIRRAERATVLWVDDRPNNNVYERASLEAVGIRFVLATSTDESLDKVKSQSFNVIISDMGRPPDMQAGYTLLEKLRESGDHTPFIIYTGSGAPDHVTEAKRRGAFGCTNRPNELFEMVLSALRREV